MQGQGARAAEEERPVDGGACGGMADGRHNLVSNERRVRSIRLSPSPRGSLVEEVNRFTLDGGLRNPLSSAYELCAAFPRLVSVVFDRLMH